MNIIGPELQRTAECEAVLRSLPEWFGIERALLMYVADAGKLPTFAIEESGCVIGFLTLREHFLFSWEVHCMAIQSADRGKGLGSKLLAHSESWLVKQGVKFLQVKTVAATAKSTEYAETRKFYESKGFTPIEVFPELWDPWNPALQCLKFLDAP